MSGESNLLELYRQYRGEADIVVNEKAMFILAFIQEFKIVSLDVLATHLGSRGWTPLAMIRTLNKLHEAGMITSSPIFFVEASIRGKALTILFNNALNRSEGETALRDDLAIKTNGTVYEILVLADPYLTKDELDSLIDHLNEIVNQFGLRIEEVPTRGRTFVSSVSNETVNPYYITLKVEGNSSQISELENHILAHHIGVSGEIIRFLIVRISPPMGVNPRWYYLRQRRAAERVIGTHIPGVSASILVHQ